MLSELWDDSAGKCTLRKLTTSCPVISIHQDDVVYLSSKVGLYDGKAWVVGVDLRVKTVEILEPYSAEGTSLYQISFPACTFSEQLNTNPRLCAQEDSHAQNSVLNDHLSSGYGNENNLRPQQNMLNVGNYYGSFYEHGDTTHPGCHNYHQLIQLQPQFVLPHSFPQAPQSNLTSSGSGYLHQVNIQLTYPVPVLNTDAYDQLWLSMPLDNHFVVHLPRTAAAPAVPFNTPMMPQVWMRAPTALPFTQPQSSFLPPSTAAYGFLNNW